LSQVLDRGANAVARGIARCALQVLYRGIQAVARGAATLSQQEKNNSADVQRNGVNVADVIHRSSAAALTHVSTVVTPPAPVCGHKTRRGLPVALPEADEWQEKNNSADVSK
jgi:hypothetical protein